MAQKVSKHPFLPNTIALGVDRLWTRDIYYRVLAGSWWHMALTAALAFVGINMAFAAAYMLVPGAILNLQPRSFEQAFFFSVQTLATVGYGNMYPVLRAGHLLVTAEAFLGMWVTALMTGLVFAKFSRPTARVTFSRHAVVHNRDGVPHLCFRMANTRHNTLAEAQLRVTILTRTVTKEGESVARLTELPLVRDRSPMFILSWLAMHEINEKSPFYGLSTNEEIKDISLTLSLSGLDETLGQTVYARHRYESADILWGARYADVIRVREDGVRIIDYAHFHKTHPAPLHGAAPDERAAASAS